MKESEFSLVPKILHFAALAGRAHARSVRRVGMFCALTSFDSITLTQQLHFLRASLSGLLS